MALTITQLRTAIGNISGLEIGAGQNVDIQQVLVDQFIEEGYRQIVAVETRWPWFQQTLNFYTTNNLHKYNGLGAPSGNGVESEYNFTSIDPTAGSPGVLEYNNFQQVISLTNESNSGNKLIYIDHFRAEQIWSGTNDIANIPQYYSIWGQYIHLWPKPNNAGDDGTAMGNVDGNGVAIPIQPKYGTFNTDRDSGRYYISMRVYRQPTFEWLTNTNLDVDLNDEFHMMLCNYVMARIFQFQEDPEMAQVYMNHFEKGVAIARGSLTAPNANQQVILSGGLQGSMYDFQRYMGNLAIRAVATGEWS